VAVSTVNSAYGDQTQVSCTPLRSYEKFSQHVLGLTKEVAMPATKKIRTGGRLFWLHFTVEYTGKLLISCTLISENILILFSNITDTVEAKKIK